MFAKKVPRPHHLRDQPLKWEMIWRELRRIIKPGRAIALFGMQPFTTDLIVSNRDEFRYCWYWECNRAANPFHKDKMPAKVISEICVFGKKCPMFNAPKVLLSKPVWRKAGFGSNLYNVTKVTATERRLKWSKRHPNLLSYRNGFRPLPFQKPTDLCEFLIKAYTNEGDMVLDFCMGSGTTGVACKNVNRRFIGIENEERMFTIAQERIAKVKVWRVQRAG